jgi:hypothetical protein
VSLVVLAVKPKVTSGISHRGSSPLWAIAGRLAHLRFRSPVVWLRQGAPGGASPIIYREVSTSSRHAADLVGFLALQCGASSPCLTFPLGRPGPLAGSGPAWTEWARRRPQPTRLQSSRRATAQSRPNFGITR